MSNTTTGESLSDAVTRLVKDGWHFKSIDGVSFYAHHDDGKYFRCNKVADLVTAIDESVRAAAEATSNEGATTVDALLSPSDAAVLDSVTNQ